ncbi:MAG: hypothetical protein ACREL7_10910 [Longimicrobiales bacterium]
MSRLNPIRVRNVLGFALLAIALFPISVAAQTTADSLRARMRELETRLDSLRAAIERIEAGGALVRPDTADALARIRAAAAAAAGGDTITEPAGEQAFEGRSRNLNLLNPEISVTGDVLAFVNTEASDRNNFVPREFEFSFISNLDPFSRAKIFVAHHLHGGELLPFEDAGDEHAAEEEEHGGDVDIEEGYVEWVGLSGGLSVVLGKFRQRFGRLNRWHAHALPAQQLPLPYMTFLGEEGLAQTGVSVHWLTPLHSFGTWELWGELTRSSSETLFGESSGPSFLAHLNGFWELSPAAYFEIGLSGIGGQHEADAAEDMFDSRVLGIDFTLDWTPPAESKYRQATLHGGYVWNRRSFDAGGAADAKGGFVIGEYKFARQWIVGARYEYTENPALTSESSWLVGPSITWWQSEFVRVRAAYEMLDRPGERFGQFVLQTTFAMGPHKHESY